jgi:hypothetical protein
MDVGYVPKLSEERDALVQFTEHFLSDMKPHELPSVLLFFHHIGYRPDTVRPPGATPFGSAHLRWLPPPTRTMQLIHLQRSLTVEGAAASRRDLWRTCVSRCTVA